MNRDNKYDASQTFEKWTPIVPALFELGEAYSHCGLLPSSMYKQSSWFVESHANHVASRAFGPDVKFHVRQSTGMVLKFTVTNPNFYASVHVTREGQVKVSRLRNPLVQRKLRERFEHIITHKRVKWDRVYGGYDIAETVGQVWTIKVDDGGKHE